MYDLEEQEQIDALKAWWNTNGRLVIVAVLAAVLAASATMGWRYYKQQRAEQASQLFSTLEQAARASNTARVKEIAGQIMSRYGSTSYGPLAALLAAKTSFEAGDLKSAGAQLQWALDHAKDEDTAAVARLRLAAVRLDEKQYDEALRLLDGKHGDSFDGLYADLRGDVFFAQGKLAEAKAAYKLALEKLPPEEGNYRYVVQAKLDGLGGGK